MGDDTDANLVPDHSPSVQEIESIECKEPAPEGNGSPADSLLCGSDAPNPETERLSTKLTVDEIISSTPDIAETLSDFLEKLSSYRHLLPRSLTAQMTDLEDISEELTDKALEAAKSNKEKEAESKAIEKWSVEVHFESMQNWPKRLARPLYWPIPVIEAFYGDADEPSVLPKNTASAKERPESLLQRLWIRSEILCDELEKITGISVTAPEIIPPPFKFALHFFPQIEAKLVDLEQELAQSELDALKCEDRDSIVIKNNNDVEDPTSHEGVDDQTAESASKTSEESQKHAAVQEENRLLRIRVEHLACFRDFILSHLKQSLDLIKRVQDGTLEMISFPNLWHLFKPGDIIVSNRMNHHILLRVYSVTGGQKQTQVRLQNDNDSLISRSRMMGDIFERPQGVEEDAGESILRRQLWGVGTWIPFKIDCYAMESNGQFVGPLDLFKRIKHYTGEMRVLDLDVYPVQFHPNYKTLLRQMEERGRKYLKTDGHRSYDGFTLPLFGRGQREELQGDVFIDIETYQEQFPGMVPPIGQLVPSTRDSTLNGEVILSMGRSTTYTFLNHEVDVRLTETFMSSNRVTLDLLTHEEAQEMPECLQLMPRGVIGYVFRLRKWCGLDLDSIANIDGWQKARDSSFVDLVIPDNFRDLLVGLVENHASRLQRRQARQLRAAMGQEHAHIDLVRDKGQGLIILLHGPPGSGKTSTAETIAAFTQRPLYSITCGDLGLNPINVEENLGWHTKNADKWGCVLLLDEADVFLMQRDWRNVGRNALVSVLLRQLEYYSGILFLTTNRPGVIDEAFLSRIHISLRYPMIDLEGTKRMWTNIMNRIERDNETSSVKVAFDRNGLLAFAERHYLRREEKGTTWNGRQIRNAFQIAITLGISQRMNMLKEKGMTPEQAIASGKRRFTEVKLTRANLKNISQTTQAFEDYMQQLRGNDSDLARQSEVRDDYFDMMSPRATKDYGERDDKPRRTDSFGPVKPSLTAKATSSASKSRLAPSRKKKPMSDDDDSDKSDSSEHTDDNESDE